VARQFNRQYNLTIIPVTGERRIISDLRINFEVSKSVIGAPNLCKIVIYNPNNDTISALQSAKTKIILNAGYENNLKLLFKGDIRNSTDTRTNVDRMITLYAADGERSWQNAKVNKTFDANISIKTIVAEVIKTFDLAIGTIEGIPDIADKLRGQTLSGKSSVLLDQFAKEYGFNWSIQDEKVVIVKKDESLIGVSSVIVSAATGMIGTPSITQNGADVTTLMNPELMPNRLFTIESASSEINIGDLFYIQPKASSAEGTYKIQEVIFTGDNLEGNWLSSVKGVSLHNAGGT